MGLRQWIRHRLGEAEGDVPPGGSLWEAMRGKDEAPAHALGEYDASTYPDALADLVRRRESVMQALIALDLTSATGRVDAIPRLKELLRVYPHPLVYESLLNAFVDAERWDDAKGVAFAARERRWDCERSPHPEVRQETAWLREWTTEEIDALRAERESGRVPARASAPAARPVEAEPAPA